MDCNMITMSYDNYYSNTYNCLYSSLERTLQRLYCCQHSKHRHKQVLDWYSLSPDRVCHLDRRPFPDMLSRETSLSTHHPLMCVRKHIDQPFQHSNHRYPERRIRMENMQKRLIINSLIFRHAAADTQTNTSRIVRTVLHCCTDNTNSGSNPGYGPL